MKKIYIIGALACMFAACRPSVTVNKKLTQGDADFSQYLAIGNSLTAGYADGSLAVSGQLNSYPKRLFEQFQLLNSNGTFVQPLLPGDNGYPQPKLILGINWGCNGDSSLGPQRYPGSLDSFGSAHFVNTSANGQINNIGVPGIRVVDYYVPGYANFAATNGAPYALRFYNKPSGTPMDELAYRVYNLHPTFFTLWLGANDVLGYATAGGQGDGTGNASPLIPGSYVYNSNDITPTTVFQTIYDSIVNLTISTGARGALINIPDVTSIPYFTTVPANGLMLSREGQADTLTALYGNNPNFVFQTGANFFIIQENDGKIRQAIPGELILLTVPQDSIICAGWGSVKPIPKQYVLTTFEIQNIRRMTNLFNDHIRSVADIHHLAYIDINAYLSSISSGVTYNGIKYTAEFVTGGTFSLDGIHPTPRGYALIANRIIEGINAQYHSNIPYTDVNRYPGVKFP